MAARAGTGYVDIRADWGPFDRSVAARGPVISKKAGKIGLAAGGAVARGMEVGLKAGAVGVAAGLTYAAKKAGDFQGELSNLDAVSGASGKQLEKLRKQALKAGADTKFSALEAAQAQVELSKGGLATSKILRGGLRSALALAAAGEMELAEAGETTVNVMKLFRLQGRDAMKIADGLATAANSTTADVSDFALAFKQGGSAAKAAGLDFQQTTSFLEALAEMGIRGSDAGTSMKAALAQMASPSEAAADAAKSLNIEFFDEKGNIKDLVELSGHLRERLGGLTREKRLDAAATLVGTDGMRALLALYDAGPRKIDRYQRELGKQGTAADVARTKQDNLKGSLEQLGGSVETLGISVGTMMIPAIRTGADELTDLTNKIGDIASRDDLSLGQKLQQAFDVAKVDAEPWVQNLETAIDDANVPDRVADLISGATPKIVEAVAKAAPAAAKAFAETFASADAWGKLAIGAVVGKKLGLFDNLGGGRRGGASGGLGDVVRGNKPLPVYVVNMAAGGPGGPVVPAPGGGPAGPGGRVKPLLKGAGKLAGRIAAVDVAINLVDQKGNPIAAAINTAHDLTFGIVPKVDVKSSGEKKDEAVAGVSRDLDRIVKTRDLSGLDEMRGKLKLLAADARDFGDEKLADEYDKLARKASNAAPGVEKAANAQRDASRISDQFARNLKGLRLKGSKDFDELAKSVVYGSKNILKVGGKNARETREEVSKQFDIARRRVKTAMDRKILSVEEGTARLKELARKELKLYGISAGRVDVVLAKGANGEARPHQRGGYINEGAPSGDSVPALLERDEYVLNRRAVKKIGRGALDRLNFGLAPRFQEGGIVELLHPFNDPAGHGGSNSHLHVAMSSVRALIALGRQLQKAGWLVGEHPAFGGIQGRHAPGGYHYTSQAFDANWPDAAQEAAKIRALLPRLQGLAAGKMLSDFAGLDRVQLRGRSSVALEAAQGVLDRIRSAADASIAAAIAPIEGVEGGNFSGPWTDVMAAIANGKGWSLADWQRLVQKESGGNPAARNPSSGAFGLGQFLGATARAYAKHGALSPNGTDQIRAMAKYIEDRYGNPTAALAFHDSNNWYQLGGLVRLQAGGPPTGGARAGGPTRRDLHRVLGRVQRRRGGPSTRRFLDRLKKAGLPRDLQSRLATLSGDAQKFGEYADRAGQLTLEGADGTSIGGLVNGKSQAEWLTEQLTALFGWRNAIIDAEKVVVARREETSRLIEEARARLTTVRSEIAAAAITRKRLAKRLDQVQGRLTQLRKHPKRNRAMIATLAARAGELRTHIRGIDGQQSARNRVQDTLKEKILPALTGKRGTLNTARGELLSDLETVQGVGAPMTRLTTLPAAGVLGGQIFDVQMRLRDMAETPRVSDTSSSENPTAETLAGLLAEANTRTAVSQAQYDVFKDFPLPPYGGSFDQGGPVPGPLGAPRTIIAHGGEHVLTADEARSGPRVRVIVEDHRVRVWVDDVEQIVEQKMRREARAGARQLPGRAGSIRG